jgi:hypothetical protein
MDKLRGSGNTFSTSGKAWHPFKPEADKARKMARLHRMKRAALLPSGDKQSLRAMAKQAVAERDKHKP